MKPLQITLAAAIGLSLTACDQMPEATDTAVSTVQQVTQTAADSSEVMATVNGSAITKNLLDTYMAQRQRRRPEGSNIEGVLEELINLELTVQDGISQGVDKDAMVVAQMNQQRKAVIAGATIKKMITDKPVTQEELQALYDEKTGANGGKEYKARHVLVKTEAEANDIIAKLETGGDFSALAKELSTGPTGKNGGDLGWFSAAQMVQPFSEAVAALEKGAYTKTPVETQFGWHVIVRDDSRDVQPPPFDQLKPQMEAYLQKERLQTYLEGLKEKAAVEIQYQAPAVEAPAIEVPAIEGHSQNVPHDPTHGTADTAVEQATDAASEATGAAKDAMDAAKGAIDTATEAAGDVAGDAVEAAKGAAADAANSATDAVKEGIDAVKDAAGAIGENTP
ncbi:MAG: peptidylprolyl isomerase [Gammaproteobacteria bacterium]